jgi:hypothetical protein
MPQFTAKMEQIVTEQLINGTIITGIASASAMSNISYQDALDKATSKASNLASTNLLNNIALYENIQKQKTIYSAEEFANESSITKTGDIITSSATAIATSTISISDAKNKALELAREKAYNNVQHDVNIINSIKCNTNSDGNVKFELVEPNSSYDLSQLENVSTKLLIIMPKLTPFQFLRSVNSSDKFSEVNHNIKILNNGEEINVLKCTPLLYMNLSGKWYNILIDYVEYILKAFNKLTNSEMDMIKDLWGK